MERQMTDINNSIRHIYFNLGIHHIAEWASILFALQRQQKLQTNQSIDKACSLQQITVTAS